MVGARPDRLTCSVAVLVLLIVLVDAKSGNLLEDYTPVLLETYFALNPRAELVAKLSNGATVTINRTSFLLYSVVPAEACVRNGANLCCMQKLSSALLEDAAGLPLCGRFVHQKPPHAGLGHWLAEYNSLILDELEHGVQRVQPQPTLTHEISLAEVEEVLGIGLGVRYTLQQVYQAVSKGYLANKTLLDPELGKAFDSSNWAVLYNFPTPRNRGNQYLQSRTFFLERIRAQRLRFPRSHATLFASNATRVCVHVRRGDVGVNDSHRFLPMSYYATVLRQIKQTVKQPTLSIVVISEGSTADFREVTAAHPDAMLLLSKEPFRHFVHMLYADVLVTSRSGFSHLAAELGDSITVAAPFWHKFSGATVFANVTTGVFDTRALQRMLTNRTAEF